MGNILTTTPSTTTPISPTVLARILSTKFPIPATWTTRNPEEPTRGQIGKGQAGTIYPVHFAPANNSHSNVLKIPNSPSKEKEILQDFKMHACLQSSLEGLSGDLVKGCKVPVLKRLVGYDDRFWETDCLGCGVPEVQWRRPKWCCLSERILPVPLAVRRALLSFLWPSAKEREISRVLQVPENRDCLVRLYLGRRGVQRSRTPISDVKLRNFLLHIDDMERLGLDATVYAEAMATALAIMHWKANIDGNDVEFVLGMSPHYALTSAEPQDEKNIDPQFLSIWLLDFNQCSSFAGEEAWLKQLVDAFWWNDPYYPRPSLGDARDRVLWERFKGKYLEVSGRLTGTDRPKQFVLGVEARGKERGGGGLFERIDG